MSTQYIRQFRSHPRHKWYSPLLVMALAGLFYGLGARRRPRGDAEHVTEELTPSNAGGMS